MEAESPGLLALLTRRAEGLGTLANDAHGNPQLTALLLIAHRVIWSFKAHLPRKGLWGEGQRRKWLEKPVGWPLWRPKAQTSAKLSVGLRAGL